jgi:hypothetical protein
MEMKKIYFLMACLMMASAHGMKVDKKAKIRVTNNKKNYAFNMYTMAQFVEKTFKLNGPITWFAANNLPKCKNVQKGIEDQRTETLQMIRDYISAVDENQEYSNAQYYRLQSYFSDYAENFSTQEIEELSPQQKKVSKKDEKIQCKQEEEAQESLQIALFDAVKKIKQKIKQEEQPQPQPQNLPLRDDASLKKNPLSAKELSKVQEIVSMIEAAIKKESEPTEWRQFPRDNIWLIWNTCNALRNRNIMMCAWEELNKKYPAPFFKAVVDPNFELRAGNTDTTKPSFLKNTSDLITYLNTKGQQLEQTLSNTDITEDVKNNCPNEKNIWYFQDYMAILGYIGKDTDQCAADLINNKMKKKLIPIAAPNIYPSSMKNEQCDQTMLSNINKTLTKNGMEKMKEEEPCKLAFQNYDLISVNDSQPNDLPLMSHMMLCGEKEDQKNTFIATVFVSRVQEKYLTMPSKILSTLWQETERGKAFNEALDKRRKEFYKTENSDSGDSENQNLDQDPNGNELANARTLSNSSQEENTQN